MNRPTSFLNFRISEFPNLAIAIIFAVLISQTSCNNVKRYIYQVQEQELYQTAAQKLNLKTTDQFISIAYSHLFGISIANNELAKYNVSLQALGDKTTMQDMIVKSMINRGGVQLITDANMRSDIPAFIESTYLRFYNRKPNEFERWKMKDLIEKNTDATPKMIYYSMMTSDEYRYY